MAIQVLGRAERQKQSAAYLELAKYVNLHPTHAATPRQFEVFNPHPDEYVLVWSAEEKVQKHSRNGAEVVTASDGHKVYQIPEAECIKGKNCCIRRGMILMRYPFTAYMAKIARMTLTSISSQDASIREFLRNAPDARLLNADGRVDRSRPITGVEQLIPPTDPNQYKRRRGSIQDSIDSNERRAAARLNQMQRESDLYLQAMAGAGQTGGESGPSVVSVEEE